MSAPLKPGPGRARIERVLQAVGQRVGSGRSSRCLAAPSGAVGQEPDARDERQRQDRQVDEHRRGLGVADEPHDPDPERRERRRAKHQRDDHGRERRGRGCGRRRRARRARASTTVMRHDDHASSRSAPATYAHRGSGVPCIRFSTPSSRRIACRDRHVHERRRDHAVGQDSGHEEVVVGDVAAALQCARSCRGSRRSRGTSAGTRT